MASPIKAHVWWSLFVQTSNKRKLVESHLPPINHALEKIEFGWEIYADSNGSGLFRLVNYQNLTSRSTEKIIASVLRRAYGLSPTWTISGLEDLREGTLRHVIGGCDNPPTSNCPPALRSMVFEIEPGHAVPSDEPGAWRIAGARRSQDKLKSNQIRRPSPSE